MSSKKQLDALGDRMKGYERLRTDAKCIPSLPIYIRLDGRGFSNFTRYMERPYDKSMSQLMTDTTKYLVEEFNATIGYTQSDEISLVLLNTSQSSCAFNGKIQKLTSTIAASATAYFNANFSSVFGKTTLNFSPRLPTFDCRVFEVPNWGEAANAILWRYLDAKKNSVQMLAQSIFSHRELQNLHTSKVLDKMLVEKNVDWNTYPEFFKTGVFIANQRYVKQLPDNKACLRSKVDVLSLSKPYHLMDFKEQIDVVQYSMREVLGWTMEGEVILESKALSYA